MWPFKKNPAYKTLGAQVRHHLDGSVSVDVRGQTCPGYLLSINKAMDALDKDTRAYLLTSYSPCGDDVKAWCNERGYTYEGIVEEAGLWKVVVVK